jgi:hypothetical protein
MTSWGKEENVMITGFLLGVIAAAGVILFCWMDNGQRPFGL